MNCAVFLPDSHRIVSPLRRLPITDWLWRGWVLQGTKNVGLMMTKSCK
jgi:hypothetical protein